MEIFLLIFEYLRTFLIILLLIIGIYFLVNIGNRFVEDGKQFTISRKQRYYILTFVILVFIFYQIYKASDGIMELLSPLLYAIILAYLLNPFVNFLENKGINRIWGVLLSYVIIASFIIILLISIAPTITKEIKNLSDVLPTYFTDIYNFLNKLYITYSENIQNLPKEFQSITDDIEGYLSSLQTAIVTGIKGMTGSIINMFSRVFSLIIIPFLTFYFIKDKDYFKKKLTMTIPKAYRNDVVKISRDIDSLLGKFIRGQLIVAAFVGVTTIIGLLIIGIDFAFIIGIVAGVANVIPYFGPIIGIIPAILFAILDSPNKVIWVIILFVGIQQIESNILSPKIVGESVGLHPVVVIMALIIGGSFFGILGMLLAVPVAAMIKIISAFFIEKLTQL